MSHPICDQPNPESNTGRPVWELVIEDMKARDHIGRQRYGTPLQAHNGRDSLVDAYQEALDLCVYLRQAIEERSGMVRIQTELFECRRICDGLADRVARQSELLAKKTEK